MYTTAGQLVSALEDSFKRQITQSYNRVVDIGKWWSFLALLNTCRWNLLKFNDQSFFSQNCVRLRVQLGANFLLSFLVKLVSHVSKIEKKKGGWGGVVFISRLWADILTSFFVVSICSVSLDCGSHNSPGSWSDWRSTGRGRSHHRVPVWALLHGLLQVSVLNLSLKVLEWLSKQLKKRTEIKENVEQQLA